MACLRDEEMEISIPRTHPVRRRRTDAIGVGPHIAFVRFPNGDDLFGRTVSRCLMSRHAFESLARNEDFAEHVEGECGYPRANVRDAGNKPAFLKAMRETQNV